MSPIDLIRVGIEKADWSSVCEGYSQMTGDDISIPQSNVSDNNSIVLILNGKMVYSSVNLVDLLNDVPLGNIVIEQCNKTEADRPFIEQEEDYDEETGGLFSTSKTESIKLSKARAGVTRELRQKFTPLKLKCTDCAKIFDVHPDLKPIKLDKDDEVPEYRCDSCALKPKTK